MILGASRHPLTVRIEALVILPVGGLCDARILL